MEDLLTEKFPIKNDLDGILVFEIVNFIFKMLFPL